MKKVYPSLGRSWKGLLPFVILGLSALIWQFSVSGQLVFKQADTALKSKTDALASNQRAIFIDHAVSELSVGQPAAASAFQLYSHGTPGRLYLEGKWRDAPQIADWLKKKGFLQGKDQLNIYGCNFARGELGESAVAYLQSALGLSIAASDDLTGIDGDWELEVGTSQEILAPQNYAFNLQGFIDCATLLENGAIALNGSTTETVNGFTNETIDFTFFEPICNLDAPTIVTVCNDNNTSSDPSDDTFTYTIELTGSNTGATYSISGDDTQAGLSYGVVEGPFGPFPISSGDLTITVTDVDAAGCQLVDQTVTAPIPCSPPSSCLSNLLVNGSFEDGLDPNGTTTLSPPPGWVGGISEIPAPFCLTPNIDGFAFGFTMPSDGHVMYQEVSSSPGDVFTLDFLTYAHVDNGQRVEIQFFDNGTPIGTPVVHIISQFGECDYESVQLVTGPSPSNASHVRISAIGAAGLDVFNGAAKVDGMCLTKVNMQPPCPDPNCGSVGVQVVPNPNNQ